MSHKKGNFSFKQVTYEKFKNLLVNLDTKNTSQDRDVSKRIIKGNSDLFTHFRLKQDMLIESDFPQTLKYSNVTPVYMNHLPNY